MGTALLCGCVQDSILYPNTSVPNIFCTYYESGTKEAFSALPLRAVSVSGVPRVPKPACVTLGFELLLFLGFRKPLVISCRSQRPSWGTAGPACQTSLPQVPAQKTGDSLIWKTPVLPLPPAFPTAWILILAASNPGPTTVPPNPRRGASNLSATPRPGPPCPPAGSTAAGSGSSGAGTGERPRAVRRVGTQAHL